MLLSEDGLSLPDMPKKRYLQGTTQMYYRDQKSTHVIVVHMQSIFRTSACYASDRQPEQQVRKELHEFHVPLSSI